MLRLLLGVGTAVAVTLAGQPAQAAAPAWRIVKGVDIGESATALLDVAASGTRDAWAAGYACSAEDREGCAAIIRWNGSRWSKANPPGADLEHVEGVSAASPTDVWAVGNGTAPWAGHWTGSRWTGYKPLGSGAESRLADVAVSGGRPWLVGTVKGSGVVLGWNRDKGFYRAHSLPGKLEAVTSRAGTGEIWAVGSTGTQPLIVRGTDGGRTWKLTPAPSIPDGHLTRVWQVAGGDVWAVGYAGKTSYDHKDFLASRPIALHYDGRSWRQVAVPVARGRLTGLTSDAAGTVWASGVDFAHGRRIMFLRYAGDRLTASYGPELPLREQREYDHQTVTRTSITRIPGSSGLWAVAAAGGGDFESHFLLTYG
ncbi:hypothetical protein [Nonomuraea sp. bgisy101]|uniref:hypothetical protein n=1 Tax=Nonomuraea sp. bgisy101 TaxID=3413784 RepID=UPI003D7650A7